MNFNGAAKRLDDTDLPEIGSLIGVGEDEIHAFLDTESSGHGFDAHGRPTMLFEPHIFYRHLLGDKLAQAVNAGLAYPHWGEKPYPADSYDRLMRAVAIDETAALMSASWGLGQILGLNHDAVGYSTPQAMVAAFCDSERAQLKAVVEFLKSNHLDGALRAHNWQAVAAGYNGAAYAKNDYDKKLEANFKHWQAIKDTPWSPAPQRPDLSSIIISIFKGNFTMNGIKTYILSTILATLAATLGTTGTIDPKMGLGGVLVAGIAFALRHGMSIGFAKVLDAIAGLVQSAVATSMPSEAAIAGLVKQAVEEALAEQAASKAAPIAAK